MSAIFTTEPTVLEKKGVSEFIKFRVDNGGCRGCISDGGNVYFETIEAAVEACEYLHENSRREFPYIIVATDKTVDYYVARIVTFFPDCLGKPRKFRDMFEDTLPVVTNRNWRALDEFLWRESAIRGISVPNGSDRAKRMFGMEKLDNSPMITVFFDALECYLKKLEHDATASQTNIPEEV